MKVGVSLGVLLKVMGPGGESWGATGSIWVSLGVLLEYLGPGGVRTDDRAQKRELAAEGRWRGRGVILAKKGRGGETSPSAARET